MANAPLDRPGLLALASQAWAGAPDGTRVGHVHLQGGDVAAAAAFYSGRLGLDVTAGWREAVFLSSGGYHHQLAVNTWNSAGAGVRDARRAGLDSITLDTTGVAGAEIADPWGTVIRFRSIDKETGLA